MAPPTFEVLWSHHNRTEIDCGVQSLNQFLTEHARQNARRDIGVTHVAVERAGDSRILAYYTLVTQSVNCGLIPDAKLPGGEIGVVLLGRLAVDKSEQRRGLGRLCLMRAISQVAHVSQTIGIHALVLDAIDEQARDWYLRLNFGFKALADDDKHLYVPAATMRTAGF